MANCCLVPLKVMIEKMQTGDLDLNEIKKKFREMKIEYNLDPKPPSGTLLSNAEMLEQLTMYPLDDSIINFLKKKTCPCSKFDLALLFKDRGRNMYRKLQKLVKIRTSKWRTLETELQTKRELVLPPGFSLEKSSDNSAESSIIFPPSPFTNLSEDLCLSLSSSDGSEIFITKIDRDVSYSPVRPDPNPLFTTIPPGEDDENKRKLDKKNIKKKVVHRGRGHKRNRKLKKQDKIFM